MKKTIYLFFVVAIVSVSSCGLLPKPEEAASKYCTMLENYYKADSQEEKDKIEKEMDEFYKRTWKNNRKNKSFLNKFEKLTEDCSNDLFDKYFSYDETEEEGEEE